MFAAIAGLLGLELKDRAARLIKAAIFGGVALIFLIAAGVYLTGWVKIRLLAHYDAATVELILFGVFFLIGLILAISAYVISRPDKKSSTVAAAALAAAPLAASVARSNLPSAAKAVPLAIIGGLLLGRLFANRDEK